MKNKLLLLSLTIFATTQLFAHDACVEGIYYNLTGDSAQVTFATPVAGEEPVLYAGLVTIPDEIAHEGKTYRVTEIGQSAFAYCTDLAGVLMGKNIHRVGLFAFNQCTNLGWVSFGENLREIGAFAFYNCVLLSTVDLPASLQTIDDNAFTGCEALAQITLPQAVTKIGEGVFAGCSTLSVMQVEANNAVYHSVENCIVHTADKELVAGCRNSVIPTDVTTIGNEAFMGCTNLKQVIVPDNVQKIGTYAFAACEGLTTLIISNSVTEIGGSAFAGCSHLAVVNIPSKVATIGASAFAGCSSLKVISIPVSIQAIGAGAFAGCTALERLSMPAANNTYHSINNCIVHTANQELVVGCKRSVIPTDGTIRRIGNEAFAGCTPLAALTLPDSITHIGDYAFSGCEGLQQVTIPSGVQTMGVRAFADCIGLNTVQIDAETPPTIAENVFEGIPTNVPIIVPCISLVAYQASAAWNAYSNLEGTFSYSITVGTEDETQGTATITQQPACANGTVAIIEAKAAEGYIFSQWNDGNTENPRSVLVDDDLTFTASFIKMGAVPVTGIELDSTTLTLIEGTAHQLTATVLPAEATNKNVRWTSDQPNVAVVENGWVIAQNVGETNITVTTEEGNYSQTCVVIVTEALTTVVDGGLFDSIVRVRKVLENGTLYIIRTNIETGVEETFTIDGRKITETRKD